MSSNNEITQWNGVSPILWLDLMNNLDAFKAITGYGLANTWGLVKQGKYREAYDDFERVKREYIEFLKVEADTRV